MHDPRVDQLAAQLTRHSTALKAGENVLIDSFDTPHEMTVALIRAVRAAGAKPMVNLHAAKVARELALGADDQQFAMISDCALHQMKGVDAYIAVRGSQNITESSDVPSDKMNLVNRHMRPVLDHRINDTRWVVLRWPTSSMAQQAGMSTEAFEDFFFRVCLLDYGALREPMEALRARFDAASEVHVTGPGTDLRFSLEGLKARACGGEHNIPDGEVFSAPVRDSVQGVVSYNAPSIYQGTAFDNIKLTFRDGKIVDATANNTEALNRILDSDEGARYIGEFAIGFNPEIRHPMRDILFDEKIAGSFHFTPGQAYEGPMDNGNRSQVHWDMVCIQRPDYGGGEIYFDGQLLRKDGRFVPDDLQPLNDKA